MHSYDCPGIAVQTYLLIQRIPYEIEIVNLVGKVICGKRLCDIMEKTTKHLSRFIILQSPAMIRLFLQVCSNNDTMEEMLFIKASTFSSDVRGGQYMFPIVMLLERLPPFIYIFNPSQCSNVLSFILSSDLQSLSTYIYDYSSIFVNYI